MAVLACHHHLVTKLIVLVILLNVNLIKCHGHSHDDNHDDHHHHHHGEESIIDGRPSFKYSREANQLLDDLPEQDGHSHGHSHDDNHHHHDAGVAGGNKEPLESGETLNSQELPIKRKASEIWIGALSSTLFISGVPFFILRFIPLDNSAEYQPLLKRLLSFAAGGLLGDAFLHLIPHALIAQQAASQHKDDHGHSHTHHHHHGHSHGSGDESHEHDMTVGLWVLAGVLAFLVVEKFVRIMKGPEHGHSHGLHGQTVTKPESKSGDGEKKKKKDKEEDKQRMIPGKDDSKEGDDSDEPVDPDKAPKDEVKLKRVQRTKEKSDSSDISPGGGSAKKVRFVGVDKIVPPEPEPIEDIKVAGYLNLAADFAHNLTDGLAIGASYIAGQGIGIMTTVTILFHEIPHEIGDFAILVQSGCSRKKAMFLQLITALGAVTGTLISLVADGMSETASPWILPFTAGGFIYIACVSVIPELLEETNLKQSIWEIFAAAVGVGIMVFIAQFE